ncbi:hypothetical protein D3C73_1126440 [compost metagenome]
MVTVVFASDAIMVDCSAVRLPSPLTITYSFPNDDIGGIGLKAPSPQPPGASRSAEVFITAGKEDSTKVPIGA